MEPLVAIYDACVLYPDFLRNFLVRLAIHGRRVGCFGPSGPGGSTASGSGPFDDSGRT
jgi:hypothetical protein